MNFGQALEEVKKGKGMRLPQWKPDVVIRALPSAATADFAQPNSRATSPINSAFALPSTGADLSCASQVPSSCRVRADTREFGLALTISSGMGRSIARRVNARTRRCLPAASSP